MKICRLLTKYEDNLLEERERLLFEEHIQSRPTCQAQLKELGALKQSIAELGKEPIPAFDRDKVIFRAGEKLKQSQRRQSLNWKLSYAASLVVFCALILFVNFFSPFPTSDADLLKRSLPMSGLSLTATAQRERSESLEENLSQPLTYAALQPIRITYYFSSQDFQRIPDLLREAEPGEEGLTVYSSFSELEEKFAQAGIRAKRILLLREDLGLPQAQEKTEILLAEDVPGSSFNLFLFSFSQEMKKNLSSWPLAFLILAFMFLGLFLWKKSLTLSILVIIFIFLSLAWPAFVKSEVNSYLAFSQVDLSDQATAIEKTSYYTRYILSPSEDLPSEGFFLRFVNNPPLPSAPTLDPNSTQVFSFQSRFQAWSLALSIFLAKALLYLSPLLILLANTPKARVVKKS